MTLIVGLGLFTGQVAPESARTPHDEYRDMLDLAQLAEAEGFDALWVSEHHGVEDGYLPSLPVALAAVAAVTTRLRLGMAVALAPFQHPIRFAEDCAVADLIASGRLIVGLGIGWRRAEFRMFGVPVSQRVSRTVELVEFCRKAWTGERFTHRSRAWSFEDVRVTPRPDGPIPIFLGGTADVAVERAGRLADGFIASTHLDLAAYRRHVEVFDRSAAEAGRDRAGLLPIGFHVNAWISPDGLLPAHIEEAIWHQMGTYAQLHAIDDGDEDAAFPPLDRDRIAERTIVGDATSAAAVLGPWVAANPERDQHLIVRLHHPGMALDEAQEAVRYFAREVIPVLRGRADGRS